MTATNGRAFPFAKLLAMIRATHEQWAIVQRNAAVAEALIANAKPGQLFAMGRCPDCDEVMPVREDGTVECPNHGILHGPGEAYAEPTEHEL
jgi:hypothetical protein